MQNESPVSAYLTDVLGIRSFIRNSQSAPQSRPLMPVPEPISDTVQFIVEHSLTTDEETLISKMMNALKLSYEVKALAAAEKARIYLLWDAQSKRQLGFDEAEQFVWKEQNGARYFLGCALTELIGSTPEVAAKKKQIWNELQCIKKS